MSEARCWRCNRKLFSFDVPAAVKITLPCSRCSAMNVVALDKVREMAIP